MSYVELPDGRRKYRHGRYYRPVPPEERKKDGPASRGEPGQWYQSKWLPPFVTCLPDDEREMPPTRPDEDAFHHNFGCVCDVCERPAALWWKRQKVRRATVPRAGPRSARP